MNILRKRPLVSVVIPSYNHEGFVKEAVKSVLAQNIDSMEVIVVDDGSSDKTFQVVEKIQDKRVKLVKLLKNREVHARNLAVRMARGKYIAFQNSDDVWKKSKLKHQIEVIENNPRLSACFTEVEIIDEQNNTIQDGWASNLFTSKNRSSSEWLKYFFEIGNCLCISSAVVPRERIKAVGLFKESFFQLGDFDLWVRLAFVGEFQIVPQKLTRMRIVAGKNFSEPSPASHIRTAIEYVNLLDRYTEKRSTKRLKEIFDKLIPEEAQTETEILGSLAKHAWTLSPIQIMFANNLVGRLIDDRKKREELVNFFGSGIIHEYIKEKARVEISGTK